MSDILDNITKFDPIKGYKILNNVKPFYLKSLFPYSEITPENIILTKKKIEILTSDNNTKGGGYKSNVLSDILPIVVYG